MGDTNLNLSDIKIKNADTGQEITLGDSLKFNFDNKNLFDFDDCVDSWVHSCGNQLNNLGNKKENKNMKILDIYRERQREFIQESFDVTKEDLIIQDPFTKLYEKFQTDMKKLYKKENNEELNYKFILGENFLTKETKEAILKADEEKVFELENLDEMLEEVTALLEMTDDYDKQIEILKKYDILNEEGMINA